MIQTKCGWWGRSRKKVGIINDHLFFLFFNYIVHKGEETRLNFFLLLFKSFTHTETNVHEKDRCEQGGGGKVKMKQNSSFFFF
jgi:hypothetical protein